MPNLPYTQKPTSKRDCLDTWRARGRMPVPTRKGGIMDYLIVHLVEANAIDGLPLDAYIVARATHRAPEKRFGVVWAESRPAQEYPLPVLWMGPEGRQEWIGLP